MPRKILIVDDNELNRKILANNLSKDYDIIEADNGKTALTLMGRYYKILSAVLLDIVMPEMDGYEVLRTVRDNAALAQIPIIMVTASENEESRVKALSLGANDFIQKPYNPDIIRHCLRNNIALRETASILNAIQKDKLTGLYNREAFFEKAAGYIKSMKPGSYILSCFDIDNFKLINDQYGASEGDRILRVLGKGTKDVLDSIGGIAGRISADNFAVLYPVEKQDMDIVQLIKAHNIVLLEQQAVTFSVGRYIINDLSLPASALYDRAYIAKQSVKGRYDKHLAYFDEAMLERLVMNQQITGEMEAALTEHQFEIWFQPQYNHESGTLIGAEALVRWHHPRKGIISPGDFIPLFEQNGFVYELDKYVWRQVCRYLRKWLDEGRKPLPVSVNVSRYDIFRSDLISVISGLVREYDIPPSLLRLEITESAFSISTEHIVKIVRKLISLGFTIEIDDFGSGYSSLNTLKNVPAQVVKLDMRFLEGNADSQRGGNILESIVRMAKWLGMTVLAEGVEDKNQADFLKSIGCTYVQGYLYARPMPAKDYESLCGGAGVAMLPFSLEQVSGLNYSSFWDPNSIDTLIFNNYSGGASIYEYHNGEIELLRVSDKYASMVFGSGANVEQLMKIDWLRHMEPQAAQSFKQAMKVSIEMKKEVCGEYQFIDLPGCPKIIYLRSFVRAIASVGDRHLIYCVSENITAQRLAEKRELESEQKMLAASERLQAILDNVSSGVVAVALYDKRISLLFANDMLFKILACTREQFENELSDTPELVCPEDLSSVRDRMNEVLSTGGPVTFDYRVNRRDGRQIWIRQSCTIMHFADIDAPIRLSVIYDITLEKQASCKAAEAEAEQTMLINSLLGGIASYDCVPSGDTYKLTLKYYNDGFCKLFGYTREEYSAFADADPTSLVFKEDIPALLEQIDKIFRLDQAVDCIFRVHTKSGGYRWLNLKSSVHAHNGEVLTSSAVFIDVTARQEMVEKLRVSEEEYRLAMRLSGNAVARYNVNERTLIASPEAASRFGHEEVLTDVPYSQVHDGRIAAESQKKYIDFYEQIHKGSKSGTTIFRCNTPAGWLWLEAHYLTIFSGQGEPVSAVISFTDVTQQLGKEAAYRKWTQSLQAKDPQLYALYRCNISKGTFNELVGGSLECENFKSENPSFNERAAEYAQRCVYCEDRNTFLALMNTDAILTYYNCGKRSYIFDYRELLPDGSYRWLCLSADLLVFPASPDIEAFLMFENVDASKQKELKTRALAENDPLTGVLNRGTFTSKVKQTLSSAGMNARHALFMLDIDGFKLVNDVFGHGIGDQTLINVAQKLRSVMRRDDLIGRLGGDEFVVFMSDIPDEAAVANKAKQICKLTSYALSLEVHISASIGIAVAPFDGSDFETLYKNADAALYTVKGSGKNDFAFYRDNEGKNSAGGNDSSTSSMNLSGRKRRMLIVDDSKLDCSVLEKMFENDYLIEKAYDGGTALMCMRHYGSAISVVLLDLVMPGMDGFAVLDKMQYSAELQSIPVIVVSADEQRETCLRAIQNGATDFVTKPVDSDMLRIRVLAAISKAEAERRRAKSSCRELQSDETVRYKTVLERTGTVVVEHDWISGHFTYDPLISNFLAGDYDERGLWHILLSDMVTDVKTVRTMQEFVHALAEDRARLGGSLTVKLKAPDGKAHSFGMSVYKLVNDFGLTDKLILTFNDHGEAQ